MARRGGSTRRARSTKRRARDKARAIVRLGTAGIAVAAVARELRRPKSERTWQGHLGGVPYDFRTPSPARVKRSLWAPDDPRVFVPRAFGVGWSVNFAGVRSQIKKFRENSAEKPPRG